MLAAVTPLNLRAELDRLIAAWGEGRQEAPRFIHEVAMDHAAYSAGLRRAADVLDGEGDLGAIYAARARELADEADVCGAAGGPDLWAAARRRFAPRDRFDAEADALAGAWLEEPFPGAIDPSDLVWSDDERDGRSLICRMRRAIGARRLPLRIVVVRDLAPLAAVGDGVIQIAAARQMSAQDVERTVLHEIEGHAMPGVRARGMSNLAIFAIGTARGSDDQEGRALAIERAAGVLDARRRRELALRHIAARAVERGGDFVSIARLLADRGAAVPDALRIAARVHRGGGLGREVVYLPALLRVEAALRADPELDSVLGAGRVAVDAANTLRAWVE